MSIIFGRRQWSRCLRGWSFQARGTQLILLLLVHQTYNHVLSERIVESIYEDVDLSDNIYSNSTASGNGGPAGQSSNVVHSFRFRDFEPRSMGEINSKDVAEEMSNKLRESLFEKRKARGIHFEADGKDLSINLEFIVPVFRVPIERSFEITQTAFRKFTDLNSRNLLLGGGLAVAGALVAAVIKTVTTPTFYGYGYKKANRGADFTEGLSFVSYDPVGGDGVTVKKSVSRVQDVLNVLERSLHANNVNISACAQRAICGYVQQATAVVRAGRASPTERIVDGLVNLDLLRVYLNGTTLKKAIDLGRTSNATTCEHIYRNCKWSNMKNTTWKIVANFLVSYLERLR
ncbi:uncharacterized protein LOC118736742 [Rhagoletis pomonella]|uniref:uncharacterized protein LOC118736742 n=1 Tax=Rhagoletis pomonella TaxID=28610 RepID=UPI0017825D74|nr:uncharacterized protein LOC118736742 [Rhagoletis pomonella]